MPTLTRGGFTLVEILISLLLISAIIVALFSATGTLSTTRNSNLNEIASKIAARQIETLRKTTYASLPSCPSPAGCSFSDSDLAKLPSGTATQTIDPYEAGQNIQKVTIQIDWVQGGAARQLKMETLIYEYGI